MQGIPSSSSSPSMNSASGWFCARATFTSSPSAYWGLILRALRWRSAASRSGPGTIHQRHAARRAEALAARVGASAARAHERLLAHIAVSSIATSSTLPASSIR